MCVFGVQRTYNPIFCIISSDKGMVIHMKKPQTKALFSFAFLWIFLFALSGCAHGLGKKPCAHNWGPLQQAVPASFFQCGSIAHYECSDCGVYLDENRNSVDTVAVPESAAELFLCINDNPSPLMLVNQDASHILWSLEDLCVTKGDVVTIQDAAGHEYAYTFSSEDNLDISGKIRNSTKKARVSLTATPSGLTLSMRNEEYPGIVIEINGQQYPMRPVPDQNADTTYLYGYEPLQSGDRFTVVDNPNDVTYDYDDLAEHLEWNVYDYHRGENGEFVMDYDARYAVELCKDEIHITKVLAPTVGDSYQIHFEDDQQKDVTMEDMRLTTDSLLFDEFAWFAADEYTDNHSDITDYLGQNGLHSYCASSFLEAGTQFYIENTRTSERITGDHLTAVYGAADCIRLHGQWIEITQSGIYHIRYVPSHGSISLEQISSGGVAETANAFDKSIAALPSGLELYYESEILSLYRQYQKLPATVKSLLKTSAKLEALYRNVLANDAASGIQYYMNTNSTKHVYPSKEALMEAFFTDFYYYIAAYHGTGYLRANDIKDAADFVKLAKVFPDAVETDFYAIGYLAGKYLLQTDNNGILANQSANGFLGFCYQNGLYRDILPFLIRYFAYWRIDEGYATQNNCGADLFVEGWAPTVDIAKFFYFDEITSPVRTARMIDCLTNTAGVVYGLDSEDPLPDIRLRGYIFEGWYDNPQYSGNPVTSLDPADKQISLYAKWRIDEAQQDQDAAALVDVYIRNLNTLAATRNPVTVGYVKDMYQTLSSNAKQLVTDYPVLQKFIDQYLD